MPEGGLVPGSCGCARLPDIVSLRSPAVCFEAAQFERVNSAQKLCTGLFTCEILFFPRSFCLIRQGLRKCSKCEIRAFFVLSLEAAALHRRPLAAGERSRWQLRNSPYFSAVAAAIQMRRSVSKALSLAGAARCPSSALPIIESLMPVVSGSTESRQQQGSPPLHRSRLFSSKLLASVHLTWRSASTDQQQQHQQERRWHHAREGEGGDRSRGGDGRRQGSFSLQERMEDHPHP